VLLSVRPLFTYDAKCQALVVRNTRSAAHHEVHKAWMNVFNVVFNIGLQHQGVDDRIIPFQTQVPSTATIPDRILSGECIVTADWTLYLDSDTRDVWISHRAQMLTPRLVVLITFQKDGYAELARDAERWLETTESVARVVLVTVMEEPPYFCPIPFDEVEKAELPPPSVLEEILYPEGPHEAVPPDSGPIRFAGHCWTGKMTHVWSETWSRHETPSGLRPSLDDGSRQV
jgi:hypothetical protein